MKSHDQPVERIAGTAPQLAAWQGESNSREWLLPKRLRQGLREALDHGRGKLRMDPQDLAELIGKAIDMEVERIARVRRARERQRGLSYASPIMRETNGAKP
jgi:hypothetical protein